MVKLQQSTCKTNNVYLLGLGLEARQEDILKHFHTFCLFKKDVLRFCAVWTYTCIRELAGLCSHT